MIQVQRPEQFAKSAERLREEPQSIRRWEPGLFVITNKSKGTEYHARLARFDGKTFIHCYCEAGHPTKGDRPPVICKHMTALVIYLRALQEMRRRGVATVAAAPAPETVADEWDDTDDPDTDINNWQW